MGRGYGVPEGVPGAEDTGGCSGLGVLRDPKGSPGLRPWLGVHGDPRGSLDWGYGEDPRAEVCAGGRGMLLAGGTEGSEGISRAEIWAGGAGGSPG